jgi:hypothetical protein
LSNDSHLIRLLEEMQAQNQQLQVAVDSQVSSVNKLEAELSSSKQTVTHLQLSNKSVQEELMATKQRSASAEEMGNKLYFKLQEIARQNSEEEVADPDCLSLQEVQMKGTLGDYEREVEKIANWQRWMKEEMVEERRRSGEL